MWQSPVPIIEHLKHENNSCFPGSLALHVFIFGDNWYSSTARFVSYHPWLSTLINQTYITVFMEAQREIFGDEHHYHPWSTINKQKHNRTWWCFWASGMRQRRRQMYQKRKDYLVAKLTPLGRQTQCGTSAIISKHAIAPGQILGGWPSTHYIMVGWICKYQILQPWQWVSILDGRPCTIHMAISRYIHKCSPPTIPGMIVKSGQSWIWRYHRLVIESYRYLPSNPYLSASPDDFFTVCVFHFGTAARIIGSLMSFFRHWATYTRYKATFGSHISS